MKYSKLWMIFISGITLSCISPQPEELQYEGGELPLMEQVESDTKVLDIENAPLVDYDMLVEDIKYVPLGDEKGIIGQMKKVLYHKGVFYVYDFKQDAIFLFDEHGKCFKKISDRGSGPNEYFAIASIDINPVDSELIIDDRMASQVLFYDLQGNFKYKRKVHADKEYAFWLRDSTIVLLMNAFQNGKNKELSGYAILEMKGDSIVRKGFKYLPSQIGYCGNEDLTRGYNNTLYYRPLFSDSIYRIESDSTYSLAYYAKFENSVWKNNYESKEFVNMLHETGDRLMPWLFDTKDFLVGYTTAFERYKGDKMAWMLYDKEKNTTYVARMKEYDNLEQLDRLWGFDAFGAKDDYLIIGMSGESVEEYIKESMKSGRMKITDSQLEAIIKKMDSNSNPLLILTKFKGIEG